MTALISRILGVVVLVTSLASCGGGGGGGNNEQGTNGALPSATAPASTPTSGTTQSLSVTPTTVSANVAVSTSVTMSVRVSIANGTLPNANLYGMVRNGGAIFSPVVELAVVNASTVSVTLHTLPVQTKGRLQGSFDLYLCGDSACLSPLAGAPVSVPYDINVGNVSLKAYPIYSTAMSVHVGEVSTKQLFISVTGIDSLMAWTAESLQPWVTVVGGSGIGAGTFKLGFKTDSLAEGLQSATIVVRASNGQTVNVPIQMQVLPVSFRINGGTPTFTAVNGAPVQAQSVSFQLNNNSSKPWTATSSETWMPVRALAGSVPATVSLEPDASLANLASGTYLADVTISSAGVSDMVLTTQLVLTPATLSSSVNTISLGGDKGRDLSSSQSLTLGLNTGTRSWPYSLGALPDWLSASTTAGAINENGSSLVFTPRSENVSVGSKSATVTVSAKVNGDALTLPLTVNVNADQRRLLASEWGVAFSSSPTGTTLSRTISVRQNFGEAVDWTASSDAAWLRVDGGGNTATSSSDLVLTADPALVPLETVSYAKVTVRTASPGVDEAVIRVALWRSATGLTSIKKVNATYYQVIADKIRPYVYASSGGGIDVFNVYTGQKIGGLGGVTNTSVMSVSADGSRLYAVSAGGIAVVDLDSMTKIDTWAMVRPLVSPNWTGNELLAIQSPRVNGVDVVLLNDGQAYARGRNVNKSMSFGFWGPMVTSLDGRYLYDGSARYELDFSEMSGGMLFISMLNYANSQSAANLRDIAVADDGQHAYAAAGGGVNGFYGYQCSSYNPTIGVFVGVLQVEGYPNNVEVTRDGRVLCGVDSANNPYDFRLYTADGVLLKSYKVGVLYNASLRAQQLVVTADGFTATALTNDGYLSFVPIGP